MTSEPYIGFFQKYNMIIGVLLSGLITSIFFMVYPTGFFFLGDILLVIGSCIGLYFTFKKRKDTQLHIKTGVIVGLVGSVLSLVLIGLFNWIWYSIDYGFDFIVLLDILIFLIVSNAIFYVIVGIILGYLFGYSFRNKDTPETKYSLYNS
ncbi:MAG: hypothetical protein ACTSQW_06840 [Promethearchaeota archaeon]